MKTLTYMGTPNFNEYPVTGRVVTWTYGQTQDVDDDIAAKILASNSQFSSVVAFPELFLSLAQSSRTDINGWVASTASGKDVLPGGQVRTQKSLKRSGNVGTRIFGGRMGDFTLNAGGNTFEMVLGLAQDFDAFRVITANSRNVGGTTSSPTMAGRVAVVGDSTDATLDNASWSTVLTWGLNGTKTLDAATSSNKRAYQISDWISLPSIPRTDSGVFPLVAIRVFVATNANPITIMGNGTDSFANWATHTSGRICKMRRANGDYASTNQTTFTANAVTSNQCPVLGVQYMARGKVITVFAAGDSITEGRGTYLGEGWGFKACENLSNKNGIAVEYGNLAWSGSDTFNIVNQVTDIIGAGIYPDLMFMPSGSPNDISTTITSTQIKTMRSRIATAIATCYQNQVIPVVWPWLPSNPSVKNYGSTDTLRVAYNDEVKTYETRGMDVALMDTNINGITDGTGQVNMAAGTTTDNIHPNDNGNALMATYAQAKIAEFIHR